MKVKCIGQSKMGGLEIGRIYELTKIKDNEYHVEDTNCNIVDDEIEKHKSEIFEYYD